MSGRGAGAARRRWPLAFAALAAGLALAGLWPDAPRGMVDWRSARAVVLQSDDWGLCGFLPRAAALAPQARDSLRAGRFPAPYWLSTLEDSAAVADLAGELARHAGRDGLPAILQANTIVSALDYGPAASGQDAWRRFDLPDRPPAYGRPGLDAAVDAAVAAGVWRAELHGAFHYDPARRFAAIAADGAARRAARRGVLLFPGSATAWELGHWRTDRELAAELDRTLAIFARRFGHVPASVCAPDYVWDGRCEAMWQRRGLTVIQAKREQRDSRRPSGGAAARLAKVLGRTRDAWLHPVRQYVDRNCRFEPAQAADRASAVAACATDARRAWARGEAAVIETHRVNFASLDTSDAARGRRELGALLAALGASPGGAPLYLTDDEVAQLRRTGTSVCVRGGYVVARNLTRSARLVAGRPGLPAGHALHLPAGATVRVPRPDLSLPD